MLFRLLALGRFSAAEKWSLKVTVRENHEHFMPHLCLMAPKGKERKNI